MPVTPPPERVVLDKHSDHKRTVRYHAHGDEPAIEDVYLSRKAVERLGNPGRIAITIEGEPA